MYMVRAGRHNYLFDRFRELSIVAIGWNELGDISKIKDIDELKISLKDEFGYKPQTVNMNAGQINRFVREMKIGDNVVTYNFVERIYLIGEIVSDYFYDLSFEYPNQRQVKWLGKVYRDELTTSTKNSLGSIATIFEIKDTARQELLEKIDRRRQTSSADDETVPDAVDGELELIKENIEEQAREFIKDKIVRLSWDEMQELVAAVIRSLGFRIKVSSKGADRGKDIIASPDGLGLEEPRILVEVKHRKDAMGAPEIRSFLGGFRAGCKGIYVSTGGFSKEARYEADRANFTLTLIDLDDLADLIISNYDNFDPDGRALIPLRKIYWPVE